MKEMLLGIFRIWLSGGAVVLTVVVFLVTGSLWSLLLLLPWFIVAKLMARLQR